MSDLPPDLPRLRAIAAWLEDARARVAAAITEAEQREREDAARPGWWVQWMRRGADQGRVGVLHRRGCWAPGSPDLRAEDVRRLAGEPGVTLEPCPACRAAVP